MRELSLFTGYAGFSLGLRIAGLPTKTIGYCDNDKYIQKLLQARIKDGYIDDAPIISDIRADWTPYRGLVDIITAGFPCQPHSHAGKRKGEADERNLWPDTRRCISEVEPRFVLLENVPGIVSNGYAGVVAGELSEIGYDAVWGIVSAADIGAPHRRKRWWCFAWLADSESERYRGWSSTERGDGERFVQSEEQGRSEMGSETKGCNRDMADSTWPPSPSDRDAWERVIRERPDLAPAITKEAERQFRGVDDGTSNRVDRLKACGNGIVPAVVAEFLRRIGV
jgi:DNA (cytosine-5)-methyltransferase 1